MIDEKQIILYCDECKEEFYLSSVNINETEVNCQGNILTLVYFTCPKCNKIYRIELRDENLNALKEDLDKDKKRIRKIYGNGNFEFSKKLINIMKIKQKRFERYMKKLNKMYLGDFIFELNEEGQQIIIYHEKKHG